MKNQIFGQCFLLNFKGELIETDKITFLKNISKQYLYLKYKSWKDIIKTLNIKESSPGIYKLNKYYILMGKSKLNLESFLKLNSTNILLKNNIKIELKDYNKEEREVLNYVIYLQINIAKNIKDREIALVYDKNGFVNQNNQWLLNIEGNKNSSILDLSTNSDVFHLLQPYSNAIVVVSHNHPNNSKFSLTDIDTFLKENNIKTMIAVTDDRIYILNKYKFDENKYDKIRNDLNKKLNKRYYEPFLTQLRDAWLNRMEFMGIEKKEIKYNGR